MTSCLNKSIVGPYSKQSLPSLSIGMSMKDAPSDVASIVGVLTRQGYDTLKNNFAISADSASCEFDDVAVGVWHLQVNAYDGTNTLKYSGTTDVEVFSGQTTYVRLALNSTTGSLSIIVIWGNQDTTSTDMALQFDGISSRVIFPSSRVLQLQSMTVQLKVRFDSLSMFNPILVENVSDVWNQASGFYLTYEQGLLYFQLAEQSNYRDGASYAYLPSLHQWIDLTYTYDGSYITMYVNGAKVVQRAFSYPVFYSANMGFSLGYAYHSIFGGPCHFQGAMDDLRIWNYARTQAQIDSTMNAKLMGNEPGLVGYWDFGQSSSDTYALDRTGNGNNGQLVGGVHFVPANSIGN